MRSGDPSDVDEEREGFGELGEGREEESAIIEEREGDFSEVDEAFEGAKAVEARWVESGEF